MSKQDAEAQPVAKKPRLHSPTPSAAHATLPEILLPTPNPSESADPSAASMSLLGDLAGAISGALQNPKTKRYEHKKRNRLPDPFSKEDIIQREVFGLLGVDAVNAALDANTEWDAPYDRKSEVELTVSCLSAHGESLSVTPEGTRPWVVVTPFALPGEIIRVRIFRSCRMYSYADLLEIIKPNPEYRDDSRVQCKYFGTCSGCQYQMLSYETQLQLKRDVITKAYHKYSNIPLASIPTILPTMCSPLQYGYRTKLTPHFELPSPKVMKVQPTDGVKPDWFHIGFNKAGTRAVMDIEECPLATPTVNEALGPIRQGIIDKLHTYKRGVSLILRESLVRPAEGEDPPPAEAEKKVCITDNNATVRERVGDTLFEYTCGSFFQNNNAVLVPLSNYVRDAVFPPDDAPSTSTSTAADIPRPTHLVDAYCGAGFFALRLAPSFERVAGIELSADSIASAKRNASLNGFSEKCTFLSGDATNIFSTVSDFPRDNTVLIIDPPRKGSDEAFVNQLIAFGCRTVVYVSCNVHTQARDVGVILRKSEEKMRREGGGRRYVIESLRGFDLFPQTAHVESVAVLRLVDVKEAGRGAGPEAGPSAEPKVEVLMETAAT